MILRNSRDYCGQFTYVWSLDSVPQGFVSIKCREELEWSCIVASSRPAVEEGLGGGGALDSICADCLPGERLRTQPSVAGASSANLKNASVSSSFPPCSPLCLSPSLRLPKVILLWSKLCLAAYAFIRHDP